MKHICIECGEDCDCGQWQSACMVCSICIEQKIYDKEKLEELVMADEEEKEAEHECDENCRACIDCYMKTGDTICNKICEHSDNKDK